MKDFFISYTKTDREWAEWIAWQLESVGYTTVLQVWDFLPGCNFILKMDQVLKETRRTIAIISTEYFKSLMGSSEWAAVFLKDPPGGEFSLVPVRVCQCKPEGLLAAISYIDLHGLSEVEAKRVLLEGIQQGRHKPLNPPHFPRELSVRSSPQFPGSICFFNRINSEKLDSYSILIVEDDFRNADSLKEVLNLSGYPSNSIAATAEGGIYSCIVKPPDVVIMDVGLDSSVIDGIHAASIINNILNIPVIFCTAHQYLTESMILVNPVDIVYKPYIIRELTDSLLKIRNWYNNFFKLSKDFEKNERSNLILISKFNLPQLLNFEDPIIVMNNKFEIIFFNLVMENFIGISHENVFLRSFENIITLNDNHHKKTKIEKIVQETRVSDFSLQFPNGLQKTFDIEIKKVINLKDECHGFLIILKSPHR